MPTTTDITAQLAAMLTDSDDRAAEGLAPTTRPVPAARPAHITLRQRADAVAASPVFAELPTVRALAEANAQAEEAQHPSFERFAGGGYSGRGPTGRLRNFRAMNDTKLLNTYDQVRYEGDDAEALAAVRAEATSRNLI